MTAPTIINQSVEVVELTELTTHPKNPRQGDLGAVHASFAAHGFYGTIVAQRSTGHIIVGNHRYMAAQQSGMTSLPVAFIDVDDETALRIMLADNRTSDLGTYDDAVLLDLLAELDKTPLGLDGLGYDADDLGELAMLLGLDEKTEPGSGADPVTRADELHKKWKTKIGQTWRAGDHIIRCGDSSEPDAWAGMLDDDAALMWTDPPYGVEYGGDVFAQAKKGKAVRDAIKSDDASDIDLVELFRKSAIEQAPLMKGGSVYVAAPPGPQLAPFLSVMITAGWLRQCLVWKKHRMTPGRSDYHYAHEMVLYGWRPGAAHHWNADRKQTSVLEFDRPAASPEHPTMKPIDLVAYCVRNSSRPGELVIDPFCGSGSTIIACQETGRRGAGIELDPRYVAVTLERLDLLGISCELDK